MSNIKETQTTTFITADGSYEITIKSSFLELFPKVVLTEEPLYSLYNAYGMKHYLHNEHGMAVKHRKNDGGEYFIHGKNISKEDGKKLVNKSAVKRDIMNLIED